ncbi:MAG: FtsX-like permease family protein [Nitrospirota bacterium]|nr:FtsX-like permease family protein [Nitrospirota bacterium]
MWIDKQKNILDFTLSSLLRRKGKNAALVCVYTVVVFVLASIMFFTHAIKKEAMLILKDAPEIIVQRMVAGRHDLMDLNYKDEIKKITGVRSAEGRLWGYYYDPLFKANYTLMVPPEFKYQEGEIGIGQGVSRSAVTEEGNVMPFFGIDGKLTSFRIRELLSSESELITSDLVLMSEQDFRALFGIPAGRVTDLAVTVGNPQEVVTIANKIKKQLPDTRPIIREEILRTYDSIFDWRGGIMFVIFSGALLAFIIFAWDKASGLSAEERKEIGILKATGWETSDVILMKFWEGTVISLTSFLTGMILAYLHVFFSSAALFEPVLKGWAVLYPQFRLVPYINAYQVATLFFLTVVPYTTATIIPTWRAAIVDPDSVMRT